MSVSAIREAGLAVFRELEWASKALRDDQRRKEIERSTKAFASLFQREGRLYLERLPRLATFFLQEAAYDADLVDIFAEVHGLTRAQADDAMVDALMGGVSQGYTAQAGKFGLDTSFKVKPERAIEWARKNAAVKVSQVTETTKSAIRQIIVKGLEEGKSYGEVAREIKSKFSDFSVGKPQHHIRSRAELVAVTENAMAFEEGAAQLVDDVQAVGLTMEKSWSNTGDELVSEGCLENSSAGWIDSDDPFPSGDDHSPRFPGCRCAVLYRLKEE